MLTVKCLIVIFQVLINSLFYLLLLLFFFFLFSPGYLCRNGWLLFSIFNDKHHPAFLLRGPQDGL